MLPLNKSQIPGLFQKARALEQAGDLTKAQGGYEDILKLDRANAPALFQLGQIHFKRRDIDAAIGYFERAADSRPGEPAIWQLFGRAVAERGDPQFTRHFLSKAKKARLDPKLLLALQEMLRTSTGKTRTSIGSAPAKDVGRAIELLQAGRAQEAEQLAARLRKAHPKVAIIADILANAQAAIGKFDDAEKSFRAAQALDPNYAETRSNFGRFLVERTRYREAVEELTHALKLAPKMVRAMVHLGVALRRDYSVRKAEIAFRKALELEPDNREARMELGQLLVNENQPKEALEHLQRARELGAADAETDIWMSRALSALERGDEALDLLAKAESEFGNDPEIVFSKALLCQSLGKFDDARAAFLRAFELAPNEGRYFRSFVTSEKLTPDSPLISKMEEAFRAKETSADSRINLGFALGKVMEDTKQYDRVFTYLKPANDWMSQAFPFDYDMLHTQYRALMDSMQDVDFEGLEIPGCTDYAPIFVTGLPRSGTTLVEQILSSHSTVTAGGELGFARRAWGDRLLLSDTVVRPWSDLSVADIAQTGKLIESQMRERFGDAARVTDKSVQSYIMIGPIRLSLPNARFVVVRRDPRDNLLSMYKNIFPGGKHLHSYDLRNLARYYRLFEMILKFWDSKMPGWIHQIEYEKLIADPEVEARALVAACGLDWEDQCLNFYENKRRVDTLSVHQVRQPIYSSSMQAWRRYEADLTEMLEELGEEYAPGGGT